MISAIVGRISAHYIALLIVSWFLNTTKSQLVATLSPFISRKSQNSTVLPKPVPVQLWRHEAARHGQSLISHGIAAFLASYYRAIMDVLNQKQWYKLCSKMFFVFFRNFSKFFEKPINFFFEKWTTSNSYALWDLRPIIISITTDDNFLFHVTSL
jgi:hypothetical protein